MEALLMFLLDLAYIEVWKSMSVQQLERKVQISLNEPHENHTEIDESSESFGKCCNHSKPQTH